MNTDFRLGSWSVSTYSLHHSTLFYLRSRNGTQWPDNTDWLRVWCFSWNILLLSFHGQTPYNTDTDFWFHIWYLTTNLVKESNIWGWDTSDPFPLPPSMVWHLITPVPAQSCLLAGSVAIGPPTSEDVSAGAPNLVFSSRDHSRPIRGQLQWLSVRRHESGRRRLSWTASPSRTCSQRRWSYRGEFNKKS